MLFFPFGLRPGGLGVSLEADRALSDLVFSYQRKQTEPFIKACDELHSKKLPEKSQNNLIALLDKFWIGDYGTYEMAQKLGYRLQSLQEDGLISRFNPKELIKHFRLPTLKDCLETKTRYLFTDTTIGGVETKYGVLAVVGSGCNSNKFIFLLQDNKVISAYIKEGKISIRDNMRVLDLRTGEMTATNFCKRKLLPPDIKKDADTLLKAYRSALNTIGIDFFTRNKVSKCDE